MKWSASGEQKGTFTDSKFYTIQFCGVILSSLVQPPLPNSPRLVPDPVTAERSISMLTITSIYRNWDSAFVQHF